VTNPTTHWHAEHSNFAKLLDVLDRQLALFHAGENPNYELMLDVVSYLRHFPDRQHHPREDVAFARLAARDPTTQVKVNRLLQEHRVLAKAGDDLLGLLNQAADEAIIARAEVEAAAATYLIYYRHHIASEERDILPRAAELLTPEDWSAVAAAVPPGHDPLFGDQSEERYRELRRLIALASS
jgi:hemerythrin-like domain-containing protein